MSEQLTPEEMEYVFRKVRNELAHMDSTKRRIITQNENSFGHWVRNTISNVARALGFVITLPFRVVGEIISGLWRAIFG